MIDYIRTSSQNKYFISILYRHRRLDKFTKLRHARYINICIYINMCMYMLQQTSNAIVQRKFSIVPAVHVLLNQIVVVNGFTTKPDSTANYQLCQRMDGCSITSVTTENQMTSVAESSTLANRVSTIMKPKLQLTRIA